MVSNFPTDRSKTTWIFTLVSTVIAMVLFNGWLLDINFKKVSEQGDWVQHTFDVIDQLNQSLSDTRAGEANVAAYLETRDPLRLKFFQENEELTFKVPRPSLEIMRSSKFMLESLKIFFVITRNR
jgi:hypothetical protein